MFNSFHHHAGDTTNVHVEQQPNDAADAARLHGEIRAKAVEEAATAVIDRLGAHNEFKIIKLAGEVRMDSYTRHVRAVFSLNGELYDIQVSETEDLEREVRRQIALKLVTEIMQRLERR